MADLVWRMGRAWFEIALLLLPRPVRRRAGDGMRLIFAARQREAWHARGGIGVLSVWRSELAGVVAAAYVGRREFRDSGRGHQRHGWGMLPDVRIALRSVRRRPAPSLLAIATCALGIGGASAMFSVVDGVLLRPLPFPDPERIVSVYPTIEEWRDDPQLRGSSERASFSWPEYVEWRERQRSFVQAAGITGAGLHLTGSGRARSIMAGVVTWEFFPLLGVAPLLGRTFAPDEAGGAEADVVVITESLWRSQLGGDPAVVGSMIILNERPRTIIGVVPDHVRETGFARELWLPRAGPAVEDQRRNHDMSVVARLADGVDIARAQAETAQILRGISERHDDITHDARIVPRLDDQTRRVRKPLMLLMAGAILLLVAACVNFAALQLGSGLDRQNELAVRGALGAGRPRLVRLLLVESTFIAVAGGLLGVLLAHGLLRALLLLAPPGIPRLDGVTLDMRVMMPALIVSVLAGAVFGLLPAVPLSRVDLAGRIRAARSGSRERSALHSLLVVTQVALATVLLVAAGLLGRTLIGLDRTDVGFRADSLLTFGAAPLMSRFPQGDEFAAAYNGYLEALAEELRSVPGVMAVARTSTLPFSGDRANNPVEPEGYEPAPGEVLSAERHIVSGNFLEMMGARLIEGRLLTPDDDRSGAQPVVVISQRMARQFWPGASAVGRELSFWAGVFTIVGVIADMRDRTLEDDDLLRFYVARGALSRASASRFVLRLDAAATAVAPRAQEAMAAFDPDLATGILLTMRERMSNSLAEHRYRARLLACFALLAALLATSGIYGVVARRVRMRTHEIGVRVALGAPRHAVLRDVMGEGIRLAGFGIGFGIAAALALSRVLSSYLHGVAPHDPLTLVSIAVLLAIAAAAASLLPSLRALRVDPILALRAE
jgi:putative ABC transport system permease protein